MGIRERFQNANQELVKGLKEDLKPTVGNWSRILLAPPSPAKMINFRAIAGGASAIQVGLASMAPGRRGRRVETFEQALARLGIDETRLQRRRFELMVESRIFYALAASSIVASAWFALTDQYLGVYAAACSFLIGSTGGFTRAFRVDQIDRRELYSFPTFWRLPEGWFK